ncbi:MAG: ABC transporter permease, partial [Treponema porcinum]|nr:ABC transporter permease [Treponema porcinum]
REKLFDSLSDIKKIWYKNSMSATLSYGDTSSMMSCSAVEYGYLEMYGIQLSEGRFFTVTEDYYGMQKIILGKTVVDALFPDGGAVGKYILVTNGSISFSFEVVGVLKEQTSGMEDTSNSAYIPRGFYAKKITPNPAAATVLVQAVSPAKAAELVSKIEEYCNNLTGTAYSVNVMSMQTMLNQMDEITTTMSVMLSAIAAISLLVGGIGIMNIMIVTVTERRQEIGILIGILVSLIVEGMKGQAFAVSFWACAVSFVFSVFVGIFFGLNPAARAAKLDPVLALSGE